MVTPAANWPRARRKSARSTGIRSSARAQDLMPVDLADFRRALGQFAAGVTIVTTRDGKGRSLGLTVTAFSSVSLVPPMVLVCVDHRSEAHVGFRHVGLF